MYLNIFLKNNSTKYQFSYIYIYICTPLRWNKLIYKIISVSKIARYLQLSTITNKRGGGMKRSHCYISRAHKNKFREIKSTSKNWIIFAISKSSKREREKRSYNIPMFLCSSTCWKTRNDDDNYIGNAVCNGYREGKKKRKEKKRKEERNWIIRDFVRYKGSSTGDRVSPRSIIPLLLLLPSPPSRYYLINSKQVIKRRRERGRGGQNRSPITRRNKKLHTRKPVGAKRSRIRLSIKLP